MTELTIEKIDELCEIAGIKGKVIFLSDLVKYHHSRMNQETLWAIADLFSKYANEIKVYSEKETEVEK